MKRILTIILTILLTFSLWGCAPKETVTVDLSTMTFTAYVEGETVTKSNTQVLNAAEDREIKVKLKFDSWTLSERKDKSVPKTEFILIDNQNHQIRFSQSDEEILVAVTEKGKNPLFYEFTGNLNHLWDLYFSGLANDLAIKNDLLEETVRLGSSVSNQYPGIRTVFSLTATEGDSLKSLLDQSSWYLLERRASRESIAFEMTLTLTKDEDQLLFYKDDTYGYAVYVKYYSAQHMERCTFVFDLSVYEALKTKVDELSVTNALGASDLVSSAVHEQGYVWLEGVPLEIYNDWIFDLSETESQNAKVKLQIENWIRIEMTLQLTKPVLRLTDHKGYVMDIGYTDDHIAIATIRTSENFLIQQYLIPADVIDQTKTLLLTYWESDPSDLLSGFQPDTLTRLVWGSFVEYETKSFDLSSEQSQTLMDMLKVETWVIDPDQELVQEGAEMCNFFCLSDDEGHRIALVLAEEPGHKYDIVIQNMGGPYGYAFYAVPDSLVLTFKAYVVENYPVKYD